MSEFTPKKAFEQSIKLWWVMVMAALAGGVAGWFIHTLKPPLYEARIAFTVNVDYTQTGPIEELDLDHMQLAAGYLIFSTQVMEQVVEQAQKAGIATDLEALQKMASLERRRSVWQVIVHHPDPEAAAQLANLWGDAALSALTAAFQHAQKLQVLQSYRATLENCQPYPPPQSTPTTACVLSPLIDRQQALEQTNTQAAREMAASNGISPALTFDWTHKAVVPAHPVAYGQNTLVLAGALIGFLLGVWLAGSPTGNRFLQKIAHG